MVNRDSKVLYSDRIKAMSDVTGILMRVDKVKAQGNAVYKKKQMATAGT